MIAKHFGQYYSLQFLRDRCGISREGVSFLDLGHALESIGLRSLALRCSIDDLLHKIPLPVIVHWNNSHFVVVYDTQPKYGYIYVADPAKGQIRYTAAEFRQHWTKRNEGDLGVLLAVEPQADFHLRQRSEEVQRGRTLAHFLNYLAPYRKNFASLLFIMLLATILQAFLPFIAKAVIDVGIQTQDISFINLVLIANIAIYVCVLLSNMARDWILLHITARVNVALISDYLIKLMALPITFFENKLTGDILQRANDHERIRSFIMNNSLGMLFSFVTFIVFAVILLLYNSTVFSIFMAGSVLYVAWIMAFLRRREKLDWEYFDLIGKNQSFWVETISSIQDIKVNNYEKSKRWKWEKIQASQYRVNIRMLGISNWQQSGAMFIDNIKNLIITFYCAKSVIRGEMTFGVMISTQFIIGMLNGPIVQLIHFIISLQAAKISFLRLNEIHQLKDESHDVGQDDIELPANRTISLRNVSFQYHQHAPLVLKGIHLQIPERSVTAIVGDSGSGKSTLLKLILRLYKPSFGDILIGDTNINNISLRQWRNLCGVVMQDGKIFNDTILNNIVLDDEKIDFGKLRKAVETANIAAEIESLPLGYNTVMGEHGRGLSGGQKQRLLIARALYKDPGFLFLDEATNSLDSINEQKIIAALDNVFRGKTVVVVAHRLSTIQKADQIIVVRNGQIVEIGDHTTLMQQNKHYSELVRSQLMAPAATPAAV